ncbi:ATP-binding cassette domain-containing protein [Carboxydochorda subterranea]|uniref:ATP-binding cassette domain-containing protein n=1 Tax=Carboxydichorda subterranea TaxID=3109565 RepID=A0ABZ1BX91_9FIRM|nr:ATP-binding cassette domain-containing protein [Limnochorda sp. L945t]WRP17425.1 ATP-binding cassette domain-containing protein [Limnochorda sp. L945t]
MTEPVTMPRAPGGTPVPAAGRGQQPVSDGEAGSLAVWARGLVKTYANGAVRALDGVDLAVPASAIYAVVGPNGAGKTTLLSILMTLARPTAGEARVLGYDVVAEADAVRRKIGVAFQELSVDLDLPGRAVLEFHARLYGMGAQERERRIAELAELVGLGAGPERRGAGRAPGGVLDRKVGTYSGGMKRRLELARALLSRPRLLFLDEPTAGLDPQNREALWDAIRDLRRRDGVTVVLTTHYLEEAERLADRVAVIDRGRILQEGTPGELVRALGEEVIYVGGERRGSGGAGATRDEDEGALRALGEVLVKAGLARWFSMDTRLQLGVAASEPVLPELVRLAQEQGVRLRELSVRRPSLHDVFLKLTGRALRDEAGDEAGDGHGGEAG